MSPKAQLSLVRAVLALIAATGAFFMIGPFQGAEEAFVPWDKAAHFIAFYVATSALLLAFPERRRLDLAILAITAGALIEVIQSLVGRDFGVGDLAADAAGALAVVAPAYIERWRAWVLRPHQTPTERRTQPVVRPIGGQVAGRGVVAPAGSGSRTLGRDPAAPAAS